MKTPSKRKPAKSRKPPSRKDQDLDPKASYYDFVEREVAGHRFVEYPYFGGKPLESVQLVSTPEYHSINLSFGDRSSLRLRLEPCFRLHSTLVSEEGHLEMEETWLPRYRAPWDIG
jgi:hypothetical protein